MKIIGIDGNSYHPWEWSEIIEELKRQNLYETNYAELLKRKDK